MKRLILSLLLGLWFLAACQTIETESPPAQPANTTEPTDAVAVTRVVSTSAPPGTAVVCDDAGDVSLHVDTLAGAKVSLQIEGLQPGESPKLIFTRQDAAASTSSIYRADRL